MANICKFCGCEMNINYSINELLSNKPIKDMFYLKLNPGMTGIKEVNIMKDFTLMNEENILTEVKK